MARLVTIHRTSDGKEFANHDFAKAQEWQRYLNELAAGVPTHDPTQLNVGNGVIND